MQAGPRRPGRCMAGPAKLRRRAALPGMERVMAVVLRGLVVLRMMYSSRGAAPYYHEPRHFNGSFNNPNNPLWGAVGQLQVRYIAGADYADETFSPPGDDRPSARELMTEVLLATPGLGSPHSSLFVAWAQLISIDIALTKDNASEPFHAPCDDGGGMFDIWCPSGAESEPIEFFRSEARIGDDNNGSQVRNPINHATAFIDLDYVYGRTEEEARSLRTLNGGFMNITDDGLPFLNEDGTWKIADQRTARFPVTFALHAVFLREHNRCCEEVAPALGYSGDQDLYEACRRWTVACVQHITEEDFVIRLLGGNVFNLWRGYGGWEAPRNSSGNTGRRPAPPPRSRALETLGSSCYDEAYNAEVDVFAVTAGAAAFESAVPTAVRVLHEGYEPADDDMIDLHEASKDLVSFVMRNGIGPILRGAALSTSMGVDTRYSAVVSNLSPLFKLPVDAVQRGRDHGIPIYNDVREAYGLSRAASFAGVTDNEEVQRLLSDAYGGEIDLLDAYVGALAEGSVGFNDGFMGELLQVAWLDQMYRAIAGDRHYHNHSLEIEDVKLIVLRDLINRTTGVGDLPMTAFEAPDVSICLSNCETTESHANMADGFQLTWEAPEQHVLTITLKAKNIGSQGMLAIGLGGDEMVNAKDYIICEVKGQGEVDCIDRQPITSRIRPKPDFDDYEGSKLDVVDISIVGEWTMVKFERDLDDIDIQDYDLASDIEKRRATPVIYAYRSGPGVDQHPNTNRGAAMVNFATGASSQVHETSDEFYSLHGALILLAWLVILPVGLYYVRYRKGETVIFGNQWYEMHAECMVVAAEGVLPMAITAIVATGGDHTSPHAKWGFYMLAAVAAQILTGWLRVKALEGMYSNFSTFSRVNKHFHIWSGRIAYVLGLIQCYRGLRLVEERDTMIFSALELSFELGNFGAVYHYVFPVWGAVILVGIIFLESRKQFLKLRVKGVTKVCGCLEFVNESFARREGKGLIIPRGEDLPLYTTKEFNDKVLNGQIWVMVDGAIIDVGNFYQRHPGGSRLLVNAVGTDITSELLGEELSVGHAMSFTPHRHGEGAWKIVRSLVIGYIDDETEALEGVSDDEDLDAKVDKLGEDNQVEEDKKDLTVEVNGAGAGVGAGAGDESGDARDLSVAPVVLDGPLRKRDRTSSVKLPVSARVNFTPNLMDWKVRKSEMLATLPEPSSLNHGTQLGVIAESGSVFRSSTATYQSRDAKLPVASFPPEPGGQGCVSEVSSPKVKAILERFHVCPLLFRELMSPKGQKRPVYRFVFSCPGAAAILVQSINGACFFNLRASQKQGVVQRAYNGFAVRVLASVVEGTRVSKGAGASWKVVPATESNEGQLCIEMRIREQENGAMSKILNRLAKDPDNPVVQLQGPFLIEKIIPPPAHRNVVMIGAGTGVNPMVQTIRSYQELARSSKVSCKSRLVLVWQVTSKADLFCEEELAELQLKGNGLLEVLVLTSDEHRRRGLPKDVFRRVRARVRMIASPSLSSLGSSSNPETPAQGSLSAVGVSNSGSERRRRGISGRSIGIEQAVCTISAEKGGNQSAPFPDDCFTASISGRSQAERLQCIGEELPTLGEEVVRVPTDESRTERGNKAVQEEGGDASQREATGTLQGKVKANAGPERGLPDRGPSSRMLLRWPLSTKNVMEESVPRSNVRTTPKLLEEQVLRGKVTVPVLKMAFGESLVSSLAAHDQNGRDRGSEDGGQVSTFEGGPEDLDAPCVSDVEPGKLQVIVSGPSGFVFHVENILADMGVPERALVVLD